MNNKASIAELFFGFVIFVIVVILVVDVSIVNGLFGATSGSHTGYVTAIEHNSNVIWAANIVYFKTNTMSSQEDQYCVNDPALYSELQADAANNAQITIHYSNSFIMWKWQCNGGESIIDGVSK